MEFRNADILRTATSRVSDIVTKLEKKTTTNIYEIRSGPDETTKKLK